MEGAGGAEVGSATGDGMGSSVDLMAGESGMGDSGGGVGINEGVTGACGGRSFGRCFSWCSPRSFATNPTESAMAGDNDLHRSLEGEIVEVQQGGESASKTQGEYVGRAVGGVESGQSWCRWRVRGSFEFKSMGSCRFVEVSRVGPGLELRTMYEAN